MQQPFHLFLIHIQIMKVIGTSGEIDKNDNKVWPLFKEFRKSRYFLSAYKELYNESFVLLKLKRN